MHVRDVAIFLEFCFGFVGVFFFLGEEDDFGGVVLEDVGCDAETDACGAAGDDVYLNEEKKLAVMGLGVNGSWEY